MPLFLCIETATTVCSVAVVRDGVLLSLRESREGYVHAEKIAPFIQEVMAEANCAFADLDAVVASGGPGSYTGLRIGVSTAKGICWSVDKPLIAIPTLKAMAAGVAETLVNRDVLLCPMIDARRMEVYTSIYDASLNELKPVAAVVMEEHSFSAELKDRPICFFGDGAAKCKPLLERYPAASFMEDFRMSATHLALVAAADFAAGRFDHVGLYEPFYFKEFVAGKSRSM